MRCTSYDKSHALDKVGLHSFRYVGGGNRRGLSPWLISLFFRCAWKCGPGVCGVLCSSSSLNKYCNTALRGYLYI